MTNQITDGPTDNAKTEPEKLTSWIEWVVNMSEEIAHLKSENLAIQAHITNQDEAKKQLGLDWLEIMGSAILERDNLSKDNARLVKLCDDARIELIEADTTLGFKPSRELMIRLRDCSLAATDSPEQSQTAYETAALDRHVICHIGTLLLGTGKQCYSADAVLRAVNKLAQDNERLRDSLGRIKLIGLSAFDRQAKASAIRIATEALEATDSTVVDYGTADLNARLHGALDRIKEILKFQSDGYSYEAYKVARSATDTPDPNP